LITVHPQSVDLCAVQMQQSGLIDRQVNKTSAQPGSGRSKSAFLSR
jgi:hypothetical protein